MKKKKSKDSIKYKTEKDGYNIFDDKNIEGLMQYYKIEKPDMLFKYMKHHLTKNTYNIPLKKKSN